MVENASTELTGSISSSSSSALRTVSAFPTPLAATTTLSAVLINPIDIVTLLFVGMSTPRIAAPDSSANASAGDSFIGQLKGEAIKC